MSSFFERIRSLFARGNFLHADAYAYPYYHDEEYDRDFKTFRETFLSDTLISGPWTAGMEGVDRYALPATRTVLVDSPEEYDAAFVTPPAGCEYDPEYVFCVPDADFEREIIVIYTEPSFDGDLTCAKKSSIEDGVLKIELGKEKPKKVRHAPMEEVTKPFQRYVIIRLDRIDFSKIEITYEETV